MTPMSATKVNKFILTILISIPVFIKAQVVSDAKLWTGISVSKTYNDFEFSFSEELRMDENFTHVDKLFSEIGADYKITKQLHVAINYRFNRDNDYESGNYDLKNRFDIGFSYKQKYENFQFSFRTKIQTQPSPSDASNPTYSRNKFSIKYDLDSPFTPFLSYEFYYQFNDERVINRSRISLGTKYKINDNNAVKLFYIFENRFNTKNLAYNHIWGISYSIKL